MGKNLHRAVAFWPQPPQDGCVTLMYWESKLTGHTVWVGCLEGRVAYKGYSDELGSCPILSQLFDERLKALNLP